MGRRAGRGFRRYLNLVAKEKAKNCQKQRTRRSVTDSVPLMGSHHPSPDEITATCTLAGQHHITLIGDKFGESLGGSQAPPSFWEAPGLPRKFPELPRKFFGVLPGSSLTVELHSNQRFPGSFPDFPRSFPDFPGSSPDFPGGQPQSLGSLTPSPDSQKLSLS